MPENTNPQPGTKEYFRWECLNLRKLWGTKTFWEDPEKALEAFGALLVVWTQTVDATPQDETTMIAMQTEFDMRYGYALQKQI
jgi:hypothetical protein